jgi:hypothetical protein
MKENNTQIRIMTEHNEQENIPYRFEELKWRKILERIIEKRRATLEFN